MRHSEDFHPPVVVGKFDRVEKQVVENLFERALVERDFAELRGDAYVHSDALFFSNRLDHVADFHNSLAE